VSGLGAVGALLGIVFALAQNDIKRLLAYCSVENIGVIFIGVGGALIASSQGNAWWGRLALIGALLHVWNHGLFKALLFFGAGLDIAVGDLQRHARITPVLHANSLFERDGMCNRWPGGLRSGGLGVKFDGISSRLGFKADSGEREPHFAASVEAERDLVPKPVARKRAHRRRRSDAEKHRASVDEASGSIDDSPVGGSCGR